MPDLLQHDGQAERALLAVAIESRTARDRARLMVTGGDFYDVRYEEIWNALMTLVRQDRHIDHSTLISTLVARAENGGPRSARHAIDLMPEVLTAAAIPAHVDEYAAVVHGWGVRRRLITAAEVVRNEAMTPRGGVSGYAAEVATRFARIRDEAIAEDDVTALMLDELLEDEDDEPDWIIPGLLERRDRMMLTGVEGLGKSQFLRQFAVHTAAGLHPLDQSQSIEPLRTLVIDCENTVNQVRRKVRVMAQWAAQYGQDPMRMMMVDCLDRIDITRDRDLSRIHRLMDAWQADLVVIGPLYRLLPRAIQNDDEAAPVLAALDTIRHRGAAVLIEAHAGHATTGQSGVRDMRPRGSSALLGWPEFGFGMRPIDGTSGQELDFVRWRGPREDREFPMRLRRAADGGRWLPYEGLTRSEM